MNSEVVLKEIETSVSHSCLYETEVVDGLIFR